MPCTTGIPAERVLLPTRIAALDDVAVREIRTAACTTWAVTRDDGLYTWGGTQNVAAYDYAWCGQYPSGAQSFSFLNVSDPSAPALVFSRPLAEVATGTVRVK